MGRRGRRQCKLKKDLLKSLCPESWGLRYLSPKQNDIDLALMWAYISF